VGVAYAFPKRFLVEVQAGKVAGIGREYGAMRSTVAKTTLKSTR
jgi:hypothetical protein